MASKTDRYLMGMVENLENLSGHLTNATLQGLSAYEVAVKHGYKGTEAEWLASLKGETGATPDISIGNVTTGQPGTNAEVSVSGTPENPVMDFTIPRGDVGATPNMTIGTVTTGEEGTQAQATITGTPENPVLNLTIPKGDTGDDGFNPVVEVTKDGNTATVSVTDATHTTEVNIVDGYTPQKNVDYFDGHSPKITGAKSQGTTFIYSDGEQIGAIADGQDGYTPRKGVDYFDGHTPAISGEKIDDTTFIYADGVRIATVLDGIDGNSPVITTVKSGKTTSILADSVVIGTVSDGADGHTPTITTTKSGKTTTIFADGTSIGTISDGQDGHSPEITTNKVGKVLSILSDGQIIGTVSDGSDGQDAVTPTITTDKSGTTTTIYSNGVAIGTVENGADGTTPVITATKSEGITTIKANGVDIATINDGTSGEDGYSPTASVSKSSGVSTLTVTDESGTTSVQISDGTGMIASDPNNDGNIVLTSMVGVQVDTEPTQGSTNTISSGGVYNELTDVRSDLSEFNSYNILWRYGTFTNNTKDGVTFTWDADRRICTLNSSAAPTGHPLNRILDKGSGIGSIGINPGDTYFVNLQSSNSYIYTTLYYWFGNTLGSAIDIKSPTFITVPDNATGIIFGVMTEPNAGTLNNATIKVSFQSLPEYQDYFKDVYFGKMGILPSGNLDNVTIHGEYLLTDNHTYANVPGNGDAGILLVFDAGSGWVWQIYYNLSGSGCDYYSRIIRNGTVFISWKQFTDSSEMVSELDKIKSKLFSSKGYDAERYTSTATTYGITKSWDSTKGMYHFVGTGSRTGGTEINFPIIFKSTTAMPEGIVAGKDYRLAIKSVGETYKGKIQIYVWDSSENLTTIADISISKLNTLNAHIIKIPSGAVGFQLRVQFLNGDILDHYLGIDITDTDSLSDYQVEHLCQNQLFANFGVLRSSYPNGNTFVDETDHSIWASCDDIDRPCIGFISASNGVKSIPDFPLSSGWLITYASVKKDTSNWRIQYAIDYNNNYQKVRYNRNGTWSAWDNVSFSNNFILSSGTDLNTLNKQGCYLMVDGSTYTNKPSGAGSGILMVFQANSWAYQVLVDISSGRIWTQILKWSGSVYRSWEPLSIGGNTYNITQTINRDEISNTYNITTSPQITTDSNGWLQAIDDTTTAESAATDMTGAIMTMLNDTGYCHLGPGVFYVSGNINMPEGSVLEGCGRKTIVRFLSSVSSGYIVRISRYNTVKNISFEGGTSAPSDLYTNGEDFGSRHGIYMIANADGNESTQPNTLQCIITGCYFMRFDGSAFYAHNTGGGMDNSVIMSDCLIRYSRVGINIDYFAEYAKFSNVIINYCYYACINNGGNNVFVGCTFHGVVGWLIDNSNSDKSNNAHGSAVGCIFNHIDNMNRASTLGGGLAIHTIKASYGFVFTGCQFWYGNILIENSPAIQISDSLFGNSAISIEVTGTNGAFFHNNTFWSQPTLNVNAATKFVGNYDKNGNTVTP